MSNAYMLRLALVILLIGLLPAAATAQGDTARITITAPTAWSDSTPAALQVAPGTLVQISGVAFHPAGIQQILVNDQPAQTSQPDSLGQEQFSASVTVTAGMEHIAIVLQPTTGEPLRREFPLAVTEAAPEPTEPVTPPPTFNPTTAFLAGLLLPGLGQIYTKRPARGLLLLGAAGAVAGAGAALSKPGVIRCNEFGECSTITGRADYLVASVVAVVGLDLLGALEARAFAAATNQPASPGEETGAKEGIHLAPPTIVPSERSWRLLLLRATF